MKCNRSAACGLVSLWLVLSAMAASAATVGLVDTNSTWKWRRGTNEASLPDATAWRAIGFADSGFDTAPAPFWYDNTGDSSTLAGGTRFTNMFNVYSCVFLRKTFVVTNPAAVASLRIGARCDDGFVAWINGVEVKRYNVPGAVFYNSLAGVSVTEPVPFLITNLSSASMLVSGTNVLAVQAFNATLGSSDFDIDVSLEAILDDVPPAIAFQLPFAGSTIPSLTQIEVDFTENVTGVDATDLLVNGNPATNLSVFSAAAYLFRFPQPPTGPVSVAFVAGHGIRDTSAAANAFAGASWSYTLDTNVVLSENVRLNELVAANISGLRDEDNEPQDWVEIYNLSTNLISLAGWALSDSASTPDKWVFPAVTIAPSGYLIVFCSGKDRRPTAPGTKLHTNFKLNPDGEFLGLYNAAAPRRLVSAFNPYPNQRRDYSYGYDVLGQLRYFTTPTPGANNPASSISGIVADTKFNHDRGFYTNAFSLSITCATPGVTLRYTRDGSPPTATLGTLYSGPILVTNTSVIRAIASKSGMLDSDVDCQTYLFLDDVIRQPDETPPGPGWPAEKKANGGGQNIDYGMDPQIVNSAPWSGTIKSDLMSIPTLSLVMDLAALFNSSTGIYMNPSGDTIQWERPGSLELINPTDDPGFQINCGVRLRGGFSRSPDNPKHAFRIFFRQEYGASKLNFPMFGPTGAQSFDKFDIRTMQNYSWAFQNDSRMICLRDVMSRDAQLKMNGLGTRGAFYHLYVNGVYWGLYNTEERPEAAFAESYIGGSADDYDVIKQLDGYISGATDGNEAAWYRLWNAATNGFANDVDYFKIQGLNLDGSINTNYENLVDVPNLIDYMLVILYGGNLDAPISNFLQNDSPNNWYGFRDRTGKHGGFRFFAHDSEHTLLNVSEDRTGIVDLSASSGVYGVINSDWTCGNPITQNGGAPEAQRRSTPQYIWFRMIPNAEFRMLVADRVQKHCLNGGPLSVAGMRAAFLSRSNEIQRAIVGESARWGDAKSAAPYTRDTWVSAMGGVMGFINGRTAVLLAQLQADGLWPTVSAPAFSSSGGAVSNGFALFLTNSYPSSTLYFTLDGSDPRLRGGSVSASSAAYTPGTPLILNFPTTVRARVRSAAGVWSPITEAIFYPSQNFSGLMISEIMFNPPPMGLTPGDELEFIELKNSGTNILDLTAMQFTDGVDFNFTNGTRIGPGQFLVLGRNRAALAAKYPGLPVLGTYTHHLNNGGEPITLQTVFGARVLSVDYKSGGRWPVTPDGFGFSLVPRDPNSNSNPNNPTYWRASTNPGGSPGADDPAPTLPPVVINEALTHSDLPLTDYIELFNPGAAPVDLSGWFLTDDRALPMKYRIPNGTAIAAGGYLLFDEAQFNPTPGAGNSFSLDGAGETVYLLSGDAASTNLTGYSHGFSFEAAPNGAAFGRHVISTGDEHFVLQSARSPNGPNPGPAVGPVVLNQIMYHPPDLAGGLDNADDEYIELRNITGNAVSFYDPAVPTNTWRLRGGVQFDFPSGFSLGAGLSVLVVGFDPLDSTRLSAFRAKYATYAGMPVRGPYTGKLDNSSDTIELRRPDVPTTNGVPYYIVDAVDYRDAAPWPPSADGSGAALQRVDLFAYGNDPANWIGAAPLTIMSITPTIFNVHPGTNAATATNATFSVTAVGTGTLSYQWRKNGADLPGATNASLTIYDVQLPDQAGYSVVVSDMSGSVVSPPAYLGIFIVPVIIQPPLSQTVVQGGVVTLSVVITGGPPPFTYFWNRSSVTQYSNESSATTGFYTFLATNPPGNYSWRAVIKNPATVEAGFINGISHPATITVTILADADMDGLPDAWETAFFDAATLADPAADPDQDGMTNLQEYIAGTNPNDPESYLRLDGNVAGGLPALYFQALMNRTYAIEYKDNLGLAGWMRLADIPARNSNRVETVIDPDFSTNRFYRLVTPRLP